MLGGHRCAEQVYLCSRKITGVVAKGLRFYARERCLDAPPLPLSRGDCDGVVNGPRLSAPVPRTLHRLQVALGPSSREQSRQRARRVLTRVCFWNPPHFQAPNISGSLFCRREKHVCVFVFPTKRDAERTGSVPTLAVGPMAGK